MEQKPLAQQYQHQQMSNQQQMAAQQHQQQMVQQQQLVQAQQQQQLAQAQQQQLVQAQQQQQQLAQAQQQQQQQQQLAQAQQQQIAQAQQQQLAQAQQQQLAQAQHQQMAHQQIAQQQLQQQLLQHQQQQMAAQQQMMLCPIRVVYETPMLMQQGGDQMQQNQAIFINPQNPPPWARPVQNQVIYVQQMGNNMVPVQQGIDPNMLMQQNFVYPQMINMNQGIQEIRQMPVQLPNVIHPNVIQNIQQNSNMNDDRPVIQMVVDNSQVNPNISNNNQVTVQNGNNRQVNTINVQTPTNHIHQSNQNPMANVKPPDLPKQIMYRQIVPQNQTINRPQMIINQFNPQMRPIQTQMTNVRQTIQQPNLMPNTQLQHQQTFVNSPNVKIEKTQPTDVKTIGVPMYAIRNPQPFGYRAIQPRPINRHLPNLLPMGAQQNQNQFIPRPIAPVTNNVNQNDNSPKINNTRTHDTEPVKTEPNGAKKRKSESPEVVQKKLPSTVYGSITVTPKLDMPSLSNAPRHLNTSNDVGVNTSPVHKADARTIVRPPMVAQSNTNTSHMNVNKEILNKIARNQTERGTDPPKTSLDASMQTDKDKLVRNTVFTQARGRLLSDNKPTIQSNVNTQGVNSANVNREPRIENKVNTNVSVVKIENDQNNTPIVAQVTTPITTKDPSKQTQISMEVDEGNFKPEPAVIRVDSIAKIAELTSNIPDINSKPIESNTTIKTDKNTKLNDEIAKTSESIAKISALAMKMNESSHKTTETVKPNDNKVKTESPKQINEQNLVTKIVEIKLEKTDVSIYFTKPTVVNKKSNDTEVKPLEVTSKINEVAPMPKETSNETEKPNVTPSKPSKMNIANQIQSMTDDKSCKVKEEHGKAIKNHVKNRKDYKNIGPNDMKGNKEIQIVDGAVVKEDKDYVLTHVLDGYVIQESNVPFAIRKPLTEKVIPNTPAKHEDIKKELDIKGVEIKEVVKENVQDAKTLLELSSLNIDDGKVKEEDVKSDDNDNPFNRLKPSAVKLWTVDQLSLHLSKHNWMDTISILQEHEIDGESLFLASKPQLISIGVNETHADLICEFVKS